LLRRCIKTTLAKDSHSRKQVLGLLVLVRDVLSPMKYVKLYFETDIFLIKQDLLRPVSRLLKELVLKIGKIFV
jgi:hypothetical protein